MVTNDGSRLVHLSRQHARSVHDLRCISVYLVASATRTCSSQLVAMSSIARIGFINNRRLPVINGRHHDENFFSVRTGSRYPYTVFVRSAKAIMAKQATRGKLRTSSRPQYCHAADTMGGRQRR
eukprot:scaffold269471_cov36-Prasinocladus_malaysianus.AAC.3